VGPDITKYVFDIIENIKNNGNKSVIGYVKQFDGITFKNINEAKVSVKKFALAAKNVDAEFKRAISSSYKNILNFHKKEYQNIKKSWFISDKYKKVGQIYNPINSVGVYVPGGKFSYPSSVLMNVIPALVAGVKRIVLFTPPKKMTDEVLFAASLCNIKEVYSIGGPVAVATLAYGTETIKPVDMIVGPGNAYVNEAKRLVYGKVGIDSLAGPSEVAIIADSKANTDYIYYDLMAQAEHDKMAKAYLLCPSQSVINKLKNRIEKQYLQQVIFFNVNLQQAIKKVNEIAPEHLEILTDNAKDVVKNIKNAGAIFVGYNTPTALGDYWAGPSHVLPTNSSAKYSSGLSVMTFLKRSSYIEVKKLDKKTQKNIAYFAAKEGLENHKKSVEIRGY